MTDQCGSTTYMISANDSTARTATNTWKNSADHIVTCVTSEMRNQRAIAMENVIAPGCGSSPFNYTALPPRPVPTPPPPLSLPLPREGESRENAMFPRGFRQVSARRERERKSAKTYLKTSYVTRSRTRTFAVWFDLQLELRVVHACVHACMHACMHACTYVHAYVRVPLRCAPQRVSSLPSRCCGAAKTGRKVGAYSLCVHVPAIVPRWCVCVLW